MSLEALKFDAQGLVTVVVQDRLTGEIRMLAHANRDAVERTLAEAQAYFYSRSRQALWRKGEESGHTLAVHEVWADCDGDALVYLVDPTGPSCHTGGTSCFFRRLDGLGVDAKADAAEGARAQGALPRLWSELERRRDSGAEQSYTKSLLAAGAAKINAKLREEADELARAIESEGVGRVVSEAADVVYHLLVGLLSRGTSLRDLEAELARRFGLSGLAEKAARGESKDP
jgi:phosphoribosyl-ATP pyrophosphohydrolase/phosphoribosyl-AMP cyclohydrolase